MHQTSGTVKEYLDSKGLTYQHIDYFEGLRLEHGRFTNYDSCSWIKGKGVYHLCKFKKDKYALNNVHEAIFMPILGIDRKFNGLSIRVFNEQKHDSYLSEGASKPACMFGIDKAYKSIIQLDRVFVVEGAYDCVAMACKGFPNTVSILGTNFSKYHFSILASLTKNVIMCLDGDKAGVSAIHDMWKLYKDKINIYRVNINEDPDEFLKTHTATDLMSKVETIKWRK